MLNTLRKKLRSHRTRVADAEACPEVNVHASPSAPSAELHFATGLAERNSSHLEEALISFQRAVESRPDYAEAYVQQGEVLAELGRYEDASDNFVLALAHDDRLAAAWAGYGKLLRLRGRLEEAVDHLQRAVALLPGSVDAWVTLAGALNESGQTAAAAAAYEQAIDVAPNDLTAHVNLGLLCLAQLGHARRAETLFRRAMELAPDRVEPRTNLGLALHEQGRSSEALEHYDRLIENYPECSEYRWHRACVSLSVGDYSQGWDDHEARKLRVGLWRRPLPFPEWDGRAETARRLLVYAEQGIGDEIMFASCLPDVLQIAQDCVVECDLRLAPLFQRSFPQARVHGVDRAVDDLSWLDAYPGITAQCAIGSLPKYFRRSLEAFYGRSPYLVPNPRLVDCWRGQLGPPEDLRVGIAWRGGTYKTRRELRSTMLMQWRPILSQPQIRFFALQSASVGELKELRQITGASIHELPDSANDFDELAALLACLDVIITVQGTTAHLAGAQGRPVWILLNHSAEWRYTARGERMPWYASAKLFRQPEPGAWNAVLQQVAEDVSILASQHAPRRRMSR